MRYLSLLRDSIRESLDRKSFIITLVGCTLLILTCACIGFEPYPMKETLQERVGHGFKFYHEKHPSGGGYISGGARVDYRVTEARAAGREPGREAFEGGWSARIEAAPLDEFQKLVLFFEGVRSGAIRDSKDPVPGLSPDRKVLRLPAPESMTAFIEEKLKWIMLPGSKAVIESANPEKAVIRIWFKPDRPELFFTGHRVNFLFGAWAINLQYTDPGESVFFIQKLLAGVIVGWAGILAAIVMTAGFIPNMLQKGMIDLILSRPVQRWKVFLLKYLGGLSYVLASSTFLIAGCWLALGIRSGTWAPGFLLSIPLLVFFFAAVYAVSAFIGLHKRNVTEAIMVSVLAWLALTSLGFIRSEMQRPGSGVEASSQWMKTVNAVHAVTPPLGEINTAVTWLLMKANGITPERFTMNPNRSPRDQYPEVAWVQLFGITGAWMAFLLGVSCWTFSRRDY